MNQWVRKLSPLTIILAVAVALLPVAPVYARAAAEGSLSGYVRTADTGQPMAGVTIRIFDMASAAFVTKTVTNDKGVIELAELELGLYQITVVAPDGYVSAAGPLVHLTSENPAGTVDFSLEPGPNAPAASQAGGISLALMLGMIGAAAAVTVGLVATNGDDTNVNPPGGTQ